jgi:uncharacterized protein YerC
MRKSSINLNPSFKRQIQKTLAQTICDIKDVENAHTFLKNYLTDVEYEVLAKRLAIAYWLRKGRSYNNIKNNLKVSSATIASVQSQIENSGFQMALKNLEAEEWASKWEEKIRKFIK